MTRKDIELLFKSESYNEAMELLRKELQDDSENAEWFYYLFLAENGDYANINLNDIVCEFDFNRALDFANTRLKNSFTSEYNFYKAVDPTLRKYFAYASRGNVEKFEYLLNNYGYYPTALIHDGSSTKDFFSNLDYLVTSRVKPEIVDLNLLAINLLYLATNNNKVLESYNVLKERAEEIGTTLAKSSLANSLFEIKEYFQAIKNNKVVSSIDLEEEKKRKELEALAKSLEAESKRIDQEKAELNQKKEEAKSTEDSLNRRYEELNKREMEAEKKESPSPYSAYRYEPQPTTKRKVGYFKYLGIPLKTIAILNFVFMLIACFAMVGYNITNVSFGVPNAICIILFILAFIHIPFAIIALTRPERTENGSIPALIFSIISMTTFLIFEFAIFIANTASNYAY